MPKIAVVRRDLPPTLSAVVRLGVALAGIGIAILSISVILGVDAWTVTERVVGTFLRPDMIRYLIVFLPVGLGLAVAYHARLWNLGAEGQIVMGAVAAAYVALFTPLGEIRVVGPLAALLAASLAGALWALLPGILRAYLNVNEAITTLMMNYVAYSLCNYLVYGPWRGRRVYGYPETDLIPDASKLQWVHGYSFSPWSLVIAIAFVPVIYLFLYKTRIGTALRGYGSNPAAVELSGLSGTRLIILAFFVSGALAGLVGGNEILMYHRKLVPGEKIGAGMGFVSIMVAWLADLNPALMPLSAYYVSALHYLRMVMQVGELTEPVARFFIGLVFMLLLVSIFVSKYKVVIRK
ncbi:MAG: ABC transporter permease [Fervidicoccaceae archaeon]